MALKQNKIVKELRFDCSELQAENNALKLQIEELDNKNKLLEVVVKGKEVDIERLTQSVTVLKERNHDLNVLSMRLKSSIAEIKMKSNEFYWFVSQIKNVVADAVTRAELAYGKQ
jgi:hypothetical protein